MRGQRLRSPGCVFHGAKETPLVKLRSTWKTQDFLRHRAAGPHPPQSHAWVVTSGAGACVRNASHAGLQHQQHTHCLKDQKEIKVTSLKRFYLASNP